MNKKFVAKGCAVRPNILLSLRDAGDAPQSESASRLIRRFSYVRLSARRGNLVSYQVSYQAFHRFEPRY